MARAIAIFVLALSVPAIGQQDDQEKLRLYREAARQGNVGAQFNLGLVHASGRGVPIDYLQAYLWFSIVAAGPDAELAAKSIQLQDVVMRKMTPEQVEKATSPLEGYKIESIPPRPPPAPQKGGIAFSGELQQVTQVSVAIRLADGRIIDARNSPGTGMLIPQILAEVYSIGDQVQIVCAPAGEVFYRMVGHALTFELKGLRFLRAPSDEEKAKALQSHAWREGNLLHRPDRVQQVPAQVGFGAASKEESRLDALRSRMLAFARAMPNFVADEVATRYSGGRGADWRQTDMVESEVAFRGMQDSRTHIKLNGQSWDRPYAMLPGWKSFSGFGTDLPGIFTRGCPTVLQFDGHVREGGRTLSVVRFDSPTDGCIGFFWSGNERYYAARAGRVLLDEQEENVIRIEAHSQFPAAFPYAANEEQVAWGYVKIAGETHLLPIWSESTIVYQSGTKTRTHVDYKNHRHFEAASTIKFEP